MLYEASAIVIPAASTIRSETRAIDKASIELLSSPKEILQVSIPVKMDNGETQVFTEREYIKHIEIDCLKLLSLKRIRKDCPDRCKKLYEMGLMDKNYEPTDMGFAVLDLARRRQIRIL